MLVSVCPAIFKFLVQAVPDLPRSIDAVRSDHEYATDEKKPQRMEIGLLFTHQEMIGEAAGYHQRTQGTKQPIV